MIPFIKEERYIVLKRTDLQHLSDEDKTALYHICCRIGDVRSNRGKPPLECVVVEKDWPEYDLVWGLLRYRVAIEQAKEQP